MNAVPLRQRRGRVDSVETGGSSDRPQPLSSRSVTTMETLHGFRRSQAVVMGIDAYAHGIPPLRTAVNDARRVAGVLEADFGYAVRLLADDVTRDRLRALFEDSLPAEVQADDRLLVYFAGHGIALDGDDGPAGYLVPQDARPDDRQTFLPMTDLSGWLDRLPCRHLLLVLDCCFAGAFRWSSTRDLGAVPEVLHRERFDRYIRDPAWQVITSAAYDQKALDVLSGAAIGLRAPDGASGGHSPFAAAFLRALEGEADLYPRAAPGRSGGDGVITATELYLYLRGCVEDEAEDDGHRQTPGYDTDGNMGNAIVNGASSFHPAGCNFAFLDGSVHFLKETIDCWTYRPGFSGFVFPSSPPGVYQALSTRAGGEVISADAY
jgi:prepilin-type processing-associated H-X9-DG protein